MKLYDCEQGSKEWQRARMGIPTASQFATVLARGKDGSTSRTRRAYLLRLAGEILTGEPLESYASPAMRRGRALEAEARNFYSLVQGYDLERVGFIRDDDKGCSPDALIVGDSGMLEIKTAEPHIHLDLLLRGDFPSSHRAQCQGAMWIARREWIDLAVYWPRLPIYVHRTFRDERYIERLAHAVREFNDELAALVEKIRAMGAALPLAQTAANSFDLEQAPPIF